MPNPDPNVASRSASKAISSYTYPVGEQLNNRTVIRFVQYERLTPGSKGADKTTAFITLPLPVSVPDNINLRYGGTDTDFLMNNYDKIKDAFGGGRQADVMSSLKESFSDISKKDVVRAAALSAGAIGLGGVADAASLYGGIVKNPHTTSMFDGVSNRTFNLSWRFSARSQQESDAINNIIGKIRERILPEESAFGFGLDYPDLAYVEFEGDVKKYLPTIYRSFITSMNVSTTNGDTIVMYKSGAPVIVEMSLAFSETNIVTRKTLREGLV